MTCIWLAYLSLVGWTGIRYWLSAMSYIGVVHVTINGSHLAMRSSRSEILIPSYCAFRVATNRLEHCTNKKSP
jgi:hypothetical protein